MLSVTVQKAPKNHDMPHFTVPELTEEFQISEDSFWAFEQTGLIRASRKDDGVPTYSEFQRARLKFVIYYDSLGYSTADIVETIGSISDDSNEIQQIEASLLSCNEKIDELATRIEQNHNKSLEQIDILCDQSILARYVEEVEAIYAAAIQNPALSYSPSIQVEPENAREKKPSPTTPAKDLELYKPARKKSTGKIVYAGILTLLVIVVGYFYFSNSRTVAILPEPHVLDRSAEFSAKQSTVENANRWAEKPSDASTPSPSPAEPSPSYAEPEKLVPPQPAISQSMTSESPPDSSPAPVKEESPEPPSAKTFGMDEAPSITPAKPEEPVFSSPVNETPTFQTAQKIQEAPPVKTRSLQNEKTEALPDASPRRESPLSPGFARQEEVPKKNVDVPKESTKFGSEQRGVTTTQGASAEIKDAQEAHRDKSDSLKNAANGAPAERPDQTDGMQEEPENLLASKTPSTADLTRKEKSETPINPNSLEALDWLKKSNESIARNDTLETIVAASVAIKLDPKLLQAYVNRAWAFNERELYDKAIMDLNHALQIDPANAFVYTRRALAFQGKGDDRKAIADYQKACQLGLESGCQNYKKYASLIHD